MAAPASIGADEWRVRLVSGFCAGGGIVLLITAHAGWVPLALLGRLISPDGDISPEKIAQFRAGQVWFGSALALAGALACAWPVLLDRMRSAIFGCSARVFLAALLTLGAASALAAYRLVFDGIPHVTDAISHLFQARILAAGRWFADAPDCPIAFFQPHVMMTTDGKWFTKYSPGHPLLLAGGLRVGSAFALPLVAHLLLLASTYGLARSFFAENAARAISLLLALSPLNILLGGSLMSHTTFLAAFLAGAWALASAVRDSARWGPAIVAGFAFGWALLIRPHEFLISGAAVGLGLLAARPAAIPTILRRAHLLALGLLPCLLIQSAWNHALYGRALVLGYGFTDDYSLFPMFQSTFGFHDGFGWPEAARLTMNRLIRFEQVMLGWPVALPLLLFSLPLSFDPRVRFLATASAVHAGVYFFYDYLGHEYEARYFFNILPLLLAIIVSGVRHWASGRPARRAIALIGAAAGFVHAAGAYAPHALKPIYGPDYEQANRCLHVRAVGELRERSLVLIPSETPETRFRYSSGFLFNDPWLTGLVVYARAGDSDLEQCLARAFPDRALYRYVAGSANWCDGHFEPVAAPQSAMR